MSSDTRTNFYETSAAYFANLFLITLRDAALEQSTQRNMDTDAPGAYKNIVDMYVRSVAVGKGSRGEDVFTTMLGSMYAQYRTYFPVNRDEFLMAAAYACLPESAYNEARSSNTLKQVGEKAVRAVLNKSLVKMQVWIISTQLGVLFSPKYKEHGREWRDHFNGIIRAEVDTLVAFAMAGTHGYKNAMDNMNTVPQHVLENCKKQIRQLLEEKRVLIEENNKLLGVAKAANETIKKMAEDRDRLAAGAVPAARRFAPRAAAPMSVPVNMTVNAAPSVAPLPKTVAFAPNPATDYLDGEANVSEAGSSDGYNEDDFADVDESNADAM